MSYISEVRLADSVNAILNDISRGTAPEEAVIKVATEQKMGPAKVARLCEATNKIMSIHHLSFSDVGKKASAFALVDTQEVLRRMRDTSDIEKNPIKFKKTASDFIPKKSAISALRSLYAISDKNRASLDMPGLKAKLAEDTMNTDKALQDLDVAQSYESRAQADCDISMKDVVEKVKALGNDDAEDLANYIATTYGDEGKVLIKTISDLITGTDQAAKPLPNPSVKEGSAWVSTHTAAHKAVDNFMDKVEYYTQTRIMHQHALKLAMDSVSEAITTVSKLNEAARSMGTEVPGVNAESPFSLKAERKFNDLDIKDTFANIYLGDNFLREYDPKEVRNAYNAVMQAVPGLIKRKNSEALVKALIKRVITSNNQIDPLEVSSFVDMEKALMDTNEKSMKGNLAVLSAIGKGK